MSLFASAGFDLYSPDTNLAVSPPTSPVNDVQGDTARSAILTRVRSSTDPSNEKASAKSKSLSPNAAQVSILTPDLTCVGLSDDNVELWSLKIIKLMAFPHLIPSARVHEKPKVYASLASHIPSPASSRPDSPSSSSSSSSGEEGYFSHSPARNLSSSSLVTSAASKSVYDLTRPPTEHPHGVSEDTTTSATRSRSSSQTKRPFSKHCLTLTALSPITSTASTPLCHPLTTKQEYKVPFFSFTRTPEGSSVTTSSSALARLFPSSERYMVICGGELDELDERGSSDLDGADSEATDDDDDGRELGSLLKCLQIDLSRFGLGMPFRHSTEVRYSRRTSQR